MQSYSFSLLLATLALGAGMLGCDSGACVRNSDCDEGFECRAGACAQKESGAAAAPDASSDGDPDASSVPEPADGGSMDGSSVPAPAPDAGVDGDAGDDAG